MYPEARRQAIAQLIAENDGADIAMLAERFGVSPMTIRRDRQILVKRKMISPTHGGAVPVRFIHGEMDYHQKVKTKLKEKTAIARRAAEMVEDETCILLDAGTTTLALAKLLLHRNLSVITIDLNIALLLSKSPTVRVYVPGGEVDRQVQGLLDVHSLNYLNTVNVSMAFIGTAAWDAQKGVTTSSVAKQIIKRALINRATTSVLLSDSSKYGLCNPWEVTPLRGVSHIITDSSLGKDSLELARRASADVITVQTTQVVHPAEQDALDAQFLR